jgi:hypothetical protein
MHTQAIAILEGAGRTQDREPHTRIPREALMAVHPPVVTAGDQC